MITGLTPLCRNVFVYPKWLECMKPLQYRYPGRDDEKYVRATIQVPLLLKEAEALEAVIGKWGN